LIHGTLSHNTLEAGHSIVPEYPGTVKVPPVKGQTSVWLPILTVAELVEQEITS